MTGETRRCEQPEALWYVEREKPGASMVVKPSSLFSGLELVLLLPDYSAVLGLRHHRSWGFSPGFSFEPVNSPSSLGVPFRSVSHQMCRWSHSFSAQQMHSFYEAHYSQSPPVLPPQQIAVCLLLPDETKELWIWRRMLLWVSCCFLPYFGHLRLLT